MAITRLGVVGAGTMGRGIAQVAALRGFPAVLYDIEDRIVTAALEHVRADLDRQVQRGRLAPAEAAAALARLGATTRLEALAGCDLIIEAAPEDLDLKRSLFAALDRLAPAAILASNTSSLSVTALAAATTQPERVIGLHFFNPAPVMALVEVIPAEQTSAPTVEAALGFARALGKTPVRAKDTPGFIVNRVARPFYLEALRLAGEGRVSVEEVDRIMRLAGGFRMGPFELLDLVGLDVNLAVTKSIYEASGRPARFRPHPLQEEMVQAGVLGRKTGRGFYVYPREDRPDAASPRRGSPNGILRSVGVVGTGRLADEFCAAIRAAGWAIHPHAAGEADPQVEFHLDPAGQAALRPPPPTARRVVGLATLPPWEDRRLVEILSGPHADPDAVAAAQDLFHALGKETAVVRTGVAGVFPRILAMIVNEAALAVQEDVADPADIDTAMRLGANYPQGPLALADEIGLDVFLKILEALRVESGEDRYRPAPLLADLAAAGRTGWTAGRGFYEYGAKTHD